jgi:hypothetical protein
MMLLLEGERFTSGRSKFLDQHPRLIEPTAKIFVKVALGRSLNLDATFFVSREWRGITFLGYVGLLDRIRIALDSPANFFYFGEGG